MLECVRPRSLLMTFFGAFLRRLGGWIAVADLIALMGDAGLDEQAVRSAVSRLKRRGVIAPERRGAAAGYRLTEHGAAILEAGDARIFARPQSREPAASEWSRSADRPPSGWLLVVFSVPEAQRACATGCARGSRCSASARSGRRCGSGRRTSSPRCGSPSPSSGCTGASTCSAPPTPASSRWAPRSRRGGISTPSPPSTAVTSRRGAVARAGGPPRRPPRSPTTCCSSIAGGGSRSTTPACRPPRCRPTGPGGPRGRCSPSSASASGPPRSSRSRPRVGARARAA